MALVKEDQTAAIAPAMVLTIVLMSAERVSPRTSLAQAVSKV